jgi:cell wall-associated NlpC family hydrolase
LTFALVLGLFTLAPPVPAAPLESARQEAEALESRIRSQGQRLSVADEDYNEARLERQSIDAKAASARSMVVSAEQRWSALKAQLGRRARVLYMHPGAALEAFFGARSLGEVARARVYGGEVLITDNELVGAAEKARQEVVAQARTLNELRAQAEQKEDEVASRRSQVQRELGTQQGLLRNVRGEIAELIEAERVRQLQAAARRAQASQVVPAAGASAPVVDDEPAAAPVAEAEPEAPPPPARGSAGKAVATARAQLGKPYEWGAAGPDSFDCSGLTMYAWQSAGVGLPHSSRAQYSSLPHVARSQLQPGDLVFYGSPIHHVGIYEGGGMMINAPETGESVRRDSISRSDYAGAARP